MSRQIRRSKWERYYWIYASRPKVEIAVRWSRHRMFDCREILVNSIAQIVLPIRVTQEFQVPAMLLYFSCNTADTYARRTSFEWWRGHGERELGITVTVFASIYATRVLVNGLIYLCILPNTNDAALNLAPTRHLPNVVCIVSLQKGAIMNSDLVFLRNNFKTWTFLWLPRHWPGFNIDG